MWLHPRHQLLRYAQQRVRPMKNPWFSLQYLFFSTNEESHKFTSLDRLLRFKPALTHIEKGEDMDGLPEDDNDALGDAYLNVDDPTALEGRDPRYILGRRLLRLGKVNYRHIESLPEWIQEVQKEICSHRTVPQIRRCLEKWMLKSDRELQERYKIKRLGWKRELEEGKVSTVVTYGPEETIAYAHYFLPSRFALSKRLLREIKTLLPRFRPRNVLDFGCGPATVGAAIAEVWGNDAKMNSSNSGGANEGKVFGRYTGVDISRSMLDAAKTVMQAVKASPLDTDSVFWDKSAEVVRRAEITGERYDLVVATYTLSELPSDAARQAATQLLFELVDEGGLLVVLEAGNPQGSHAVRTAREVVLSTYPDRLAAGQTGTGTGVGSGKKKTKKRAASIRNSQRGEEDREEDSDHSNDDSDNDRSDQDDKFDNNTSSSVKSSPRMQPVLPAPRGLDHRDIGAFTVSPCTHDKPCPLSRGAWCSFSQRVHSGMIRKASEEKFSYVVLQKRSIQDDQRHRSDGDNRGGTVGNGGSSLSSRAAANPRMNDVWIAPTGSSPSDAFRGSGEGVLVDTSLDPTPLHVLERFMEAVDEEGLDTLVNDLVDQVDWDEYNPPLYRREWGRVLRSPLKSTGHVTLDLCLPSGEIARNVLSKSNVVHVPSLYTALRKTTWGGLFPVLQGDQFRSPLAMERKGVVPSSYLTAVEKTTTSSSSTSSSVNKRVQQHTTTSSSGRGGRGTIESSSTASFSDKRGGGIHSLPTKHHTQHSENEPLFREDFTKRSALRSMEVSEAVGLGKEKKTGGRIRPALTRRRATSTSSSSSSL